jgi:alpha-D-ribose 1-methylphosphonate 5-triphosphate synthase subunit PhnH
MRTVDAPALAAGFADPVHDSQGIFRCLLDAFAYPGRTVEFAADLEGPAPLMPATAAVLLALLDHDTPLFLSDSLDRPAVRNFMRFHAGTRLIALPEGAAFAAVQAPELLPLDRFEAGTDTYPDRSATIVVQVEALAGGPPTLWRGPGIADTSEVSVAGLPAAFWTAWRANNALFPCGVDLVLTSGRAAIALPRGVRVEG